MRSAVLVDTGPLAAIASPWDQHHLACVAQLHDLQPPLITSWPVLTEAAWLLRAESNSLRTLGRLAEAGWLFLPPLEAAETLNWYRRFRERYAKLSPDLADASLVFLAERERIDTVFTLDRRDFSIYRIQKNRPFRLLPELP